MPSFQTVEKLKISMSRKGLGNEACPKWNPQAEFISAEEKPGFQGFAKQILYEEIGLYSSVLTRQNPDFDEGCRLCRHPHGCLLQNAEKHPFVFDGIFTYS